VDIPRLKGEGSVGFDASGSFESVFPFGNHAELVWLRQPIAAALYLSRVNDSSIRAVQPLSLQGGIALPDTDGFAVAVAGHGAEAPRVRDCGNKSDAPQVYYLPISPILPFSHYVKTDLVDADTTGGTSAEGNFRPMESDRPFIICSMGQRGYPN